MASGSRSGSVSVAWSPRPIVERSVRPRRRSSASDGIGSVGDERRPALAFADVSELAVVWPTSPSLVTLRDRSGPTPDHHLHPGYRLGDCQKPPTPISPSPCRRSDESGGARTSTSPTEPTKASGARHGHHPHRDVRNH